MVVFYGFIHIFKGFWDFFLCVFVYVRMLMLSVSQVEMAFV